MMKTLSESQNCSDLSKTVKHGRFVLVFFTPIAGLPINFSIYLRDFVLLLG